VNFDYSAVERDRLYPDAEDPLLLKALKYAVKNSVLAPAVHARVNIVFGEEQAGKAHLLLAKLSVLAPAGRSRPERLRFRNHPS
jgi:hypothetical protein